MTGEHGHRIYTTKGQRVSRHSLPTFLYFLFSPPHIFFNSILASRTLAHLQAAQADPQTQACKRANFVNAQTETSDFKMNILSNLTNYKF